MLTSTHMVDDANRGVRLAAGAHVGSFQVIRLLGRGGMGEVYEATHVPLQRRVALKTIRSEIALDTASLKRLPLRYRLRM